tara:strand:- start:87 stop:1634 length:1548 start_codon:yes stop_codon:yes gene_type:complete
MTLDELLLEWSYRSEKGYPSVDNPSDVLLLGQILEQLDLPSNEIINRLKEMPNFLSPGEIRKYKDDPNKSRISILIKKIENDEPLELLDGGTIIVANKDEVINALKAGNIEKAIPLTGTNGESSTTSKLRKTTEFGGKDAIGGSKRAPKVNTDIKEELVIVMCNVLSNGGNLKPFTRETYLNNLKIIKNTENKYQSTTEKFRTQIEEYLDIIKNITNPLSATFNPLNNPYSIAVEIIKAYPNPKFNRGELFKKIRIECSKIVNLSDDKWNPGDIYLVNSEPTLPTDKDSIVPWNSLFVNEWGSTDAPLVSISLKEQEYQPGRAKSYLEKFDPEVLKPYDLKKDEKQWDEEKYKSEIARLRKSVEQLIEDGGTGSPNEVVKQGDGWEGKFPEGIKKLQGTYGAYKLLEFILKTPGASVLGMFAFGESIPGDPSANPTFFQMVGTNNGTGLADFNPYKGGSNTDLSEDEPITIIDKTGNANISVKGKMNVIKDGEIYRTKIVSKTFRGDFGASIGIV